MVGQEPYKLHSLAIRINQHPLNSTCRYRKGTESTSQELLSGVQAMTPADLQNTAISTSAIVRVELEGRHRIRGDSRIHPLEVVCFLTGRANPHSMKLSVVQPNDERGLSTTRLWSNAVHVAPLGPVTSRRLWITHDVRASVSQRVLLECHS